MLHTIRKLCFLSFTAVVPTLLAGGHAYAQLAVPAPVVHYTFDGPSGNPNAFLLNFDQSTLTDEAGGDVSATYSETDSFDDLGFVAGPLGGAAQFGNADGGFFNVGSIPELDSTVFLSSTGASPSGTGFTYSAWVNVDQDFALPDGQRGIFVTRSADDVVTDGMSGTSNGSEQNFGLAIENLASPRFEARNSGQATESADGSVTPGTFQHVAVVIGIQAGIADPGGVSTTFNATTSIYIDGAFATSTTIDGFDSAESLVEFVGASSYQLGADPLDPARAFDGAIDDFAVFDQALDASQISNLFTNGTNGFNASGVATAAIDIADVDLQDGVTLADFELIRDNLGATGVNSRAAGDLNGDRQVDLNDFQIWINNVDAPLAAQAAALIATSVPEPSTTALGLLALVGLASRRRPAQR